MSCRLCHPPCLDALEAADRTRKGFVRAGGLSWPASQRLKYSALCVLLLLLSCGMAQGASASANYSILHHSFGGGGGQAQSANYSVQAVTAGLGDTSSHTGSGLVNYAGFPGQITEEPDALDASYQVPSSGLVSITLSATDAESDPLTFQVLSNPAHGTLSGTPPTLNYQAGPGFTALDQFTFVVHDGTFLSPPATISLVAPGVNLQPSINSVPDQLVTEGQILSIQASASDLDPTQTLTFSLGTGSPLGSFVDSSTGLFTWTPNESQGPGIYDIRLVVTDSGVTPLQASTQFRVTVAETNQAPTLATIADVSVALGSAATVTASSSDADLPAQQLQFSLDPGAPAGALIDPSQGLFTWTPPSDAVGGQFPVTIRVTDNGSPPLTTSRTFVIRVTGVPPPPSNSAPTLEPIANRVVEAGTLISFVASAKDTDLPPQELNFSLGSGAPTGAQIHSTTGLFSWTPGLEAAGNQYSVTVIVTDNGSPALSASRPFTILVNAPRPPPPSNNSPTLSPIENITAQRNEIIAFTARAIDSDLPTQRLTFTLGPDAPAAARIDPDTGAFSWTVPSAQALGDVFIAVTVTDNGSPPLSGKWTFKISVFAPNTAPILSGLPDQFVNEGSTLTFTAFGVDRDVPAQKLTYSLEPGAATGAKYDPATLTFSWAPSESHGPGVYPVTLRVTDNGNPPLSATGSFTITVTEVNSPPLLTPIPDQRVRAGETLKFTAQASDPDVPTQSLTFSLDEGPAGATIDPRTGQFTWTPALAHPGGLTKVKVTVHDAATPAGSSSQEVRLEVSAAPSTIPPTLQLTSSSKDEVQIALVGMPDSCFRVETTTDLIHWNLVHIGTADNTGRFSFSETITPSIAARWYRAQVVACDAPGAPEWSGSIEVNGSEIRFPFRGKPSGCYSIESTINFDVWTTVASIKADPEGAFSFTTSIAKAGMKLFRAREIGCP